MNTAPVKKEYVVYRCPDGGFLLDWNDTLWKFGYPYYPKYRCVELERGMCEGGKNLPILHAKMKEKYGGAEWENRAPDTAPYSTATAGTGISAARAAAKAAAEEVDA